MMHRHSVAVGAFLLAFAACPSEGSTLPMTDDNPVALSGTWISACVMGAGTGSSGSPLNPPMAKYRTERYAFFDARVQITTEYFADAQCRDLSRRVVVVGSYEVGAIDPVLTLRKLDLTPKTAEAVSFVPDASMAEVLSKYCKGAFAKGDSFSPEQYGSCEFPGVDTQPLTKPATSLDIAGRTLYTIFSVRGSMLYLGEATSALPNLDGSTPELRFTALSQDALTNIGGQPTATDPTMP